MTPFLLIPIHHYTNTNTQINKYKYTNTDEAKETSVSRDQDLWPEAKTASSNCSGEITAHSTAQHIAHTAQQLLRGEHD